MNEKKSSTSTDVKRRYNEKVYAKITFSAPKYLVAEFKEVCYNNGISQAQVFKDAMQKIINSK